LYPIADISRNVVLCCIICQVPVTWHYWALITGMFVFTFCDVMSVCNQVNCTSLHFLSFFFLGVA
jgi:hypothetical protein